MSSPRIAMPHDDMPGNVTPGYVMPRNVLPRYVMPRYVMPRYVMFDQTRDKVRQIMHERPQSGLVSRPSWLALTLLLVAFNIIAASSA